MKIEVGRRIVEARQHRGWTQSQLAQAAGLDRTALAKIEGGQRRVTALELGRIAGELGQRMEWFVLPRIDSVTQHRNAAGRASSLDIDVTLEAAGMDVGLLADLRVLLIPERPTTMPRPRSNAEAEELGSKARVLCGLPPHAPIPHIADAAFKIGLAAFAIPLGDGADAASFVKDTYGVAVINSSMEVGRRRLALAHELGHYFINDRYSTDFRIDASSQSVHEARIDRFARSFLLPAQALTEAWNSEQADKGVRLAAVLIGSQFQVDMATLARRLKDDLSLISRDSAHQIRQVRTTKADIVEFDLRVPRDLEGIFIPRAVEQAILRAYRTEEISSSKAVELLRGTFSPDDLPDLPELGEENLWQVST